MKAWWIKQSARIDELSLRERAFLFLSVLAIGMALVERVVLAPAQADHQQILARYQKQSAELQRLRDEVKRMGQPVDTARASRDQLAALQDRLGAVNNSIQESLPTAAAGVPLALEPGALPPVPTSSPVWLHVDAVPLWLIREFEDTKRRVGSAGARGPRAPTARGASGRAGVCPTCDDRVEADDAAIECAGACGASFHVACAGVPPDADAAALADWECAECASSAHPGGAGRRETERQRALREEAAKARREGRAPPTGDGRRPSSAGGATGKRKRALVCVCRTPEEVDDPRGFVGCDGCGRWFHPPCVGTTLAAVDAAPTWHCPACTGDGAKIEGGIAARRAREVLAAVGATRVGAPFAEPVLEEEVPGYHAVVKHPMDLGTIMTRLDRGVGGPGAHYPSLAAVAADVDLVWRNCRALNRPSSTIAKTFVWIWKSRGPSSFCE